MSVQSVFDGDSTSVSEEASSDVLQVIESGKKYFSRIVPYDMEVLRLMLSAKYVRPVHLVGFLGGTIQYAYKRLKILVELGYAKKVYVAYSSPKNVGEPKPWPNHTASVYMATEKGKRGVGYWHVVGEPSGVVCSPPAGRFSTIHSQHSLSVVDVACVLRRYGAQIAFEREYKSIEITVGKPKHEAEMAPAIWCPPTRTGSRHSPDLGVILPGDSNIRFGVEVELNTKPVADYINVIRSYLEHSLNQVWLCGSENIMNNLAKACQQLGVETQTYRKAPGEPPIVFSKDGSIRFQRFRGGFRQPNKLSEVPALWEQLTNLGIPGEFPGFEPIDPDTLTDSWRIR